MEGIRNRQNNIYQLQGSEYLYSSLYDTNYRCSEAGLCLWELLDNCRWSAGVVLSIFMLLMRWERHHIIILEILRIEPSDERETLNPVASTGAQWWFESFCSENKNDSSDYQCELSTWVSSHSPEIMSKSPRYSAEMVGRSWNDCINN